MPIFDTVRRTSRFGNSPIRGRKLSLAKAVYASSTTTKPGAARRTRSTSAVANRLPVGLLGDARKTSAGRSRSIAACIAADVEREIRGERHADEAHRAIERIHPVHHERRFRREHHGARSRERAGDDLDQLVGAVAEKDSLRVGNPRRGAQRCDHGIGAAIRISVERQRGDRGGDFRAHRFGHRERVLVGVELDQSIGLGHRIRRQRPDFRTDHGSDDVRGGAHRAGGCGQAVVHGALTRYRALCACAGRPSPSASVAATCPSTRAAEAGTPSRLVRFWKS